jgi:molybdopterin synthase catalytic subunit
VISVWALYALLWEPSEGESRQQEVSALELEHYPGMTEKAIEDMMSQAKDRFDILGARVVHRIGLLGLEDQIVLVAVTSAHRAESLRPVSS